MLKLNNRYSLDKITLTPIILFETCKQFFSSTFSKAQRNPGDFDSAVLSEKIMLLLFFLSHVFVIPLFHLFIVALFLFFI